MDIPPTPQSPGDDEEYDDYYPNIIVPKDGLTFQPEEENKVFYNSTSHIEENRAKSRDSKSVKKFRDHVDGLKKSTSEERLDRQWCHKDFYYKMDNPKRGKFYIFNHRNFNNGKLGERFGTEKDKINLEKTMSSFGFDVTVFNDKTVADIKSIMNDYVQEDHKDDDCFGCAILTHGEQKAKIRKDDESLEKLWAKDELYELSIFTKPLKLCKSLFGKPKLFFIQACRGTKLVGRRSEDKVDGLPFSQNQSEIDYCKLPTEADFFFAYSTIEGCYAWRNEENGSWFIQALCFSFEWFGNDIEFLQIMTRVNNMVAFDWMSYCDQEYAKNKKQMPSFVSRLIGEIYFKDTKTLSQRNETNPDASTEVLEDAVDANNLDISTKVSSTESQFIKKELHDLQVTALQQKIELQKIQIELSKEKLYKLQRERNRQPNHVSFQPSHIEDETGL